MKKTHSFNQEIFEHLLYLTLWIAIYCIPLVDAYVDYSRNEEMVFMWRPIIEDWLGYVPFLAVFLIHNYLLAPLLLKRMHKAYIAGLAGLMVLFGLFLWGERSGKISLRNAVYPPQAIQMQHTPTPEEIMVFQRVDSIRRTYLAKMDSVIRGDSVRSSYLAKMDSVIRRDSIRIDTVRNEPPVRNANFRQQPQIRQGPPFWWRRNIQLDQIKYVIALLIIGMNLGIKYFLKSVRDEKALQELEKEHLNSELEYLKYQINPHFFMNTLNNIHALVDIDPGKAQDTILELSRLMRYILYESARNLIPLEKEIDFLRQYISLMSIRYAERIDIKADMDECKEDALVPPLMLITFVENAFKHGVSYRNDSFIHITLRCQSGRLVFDCVNSIQSASDQNRSEQSGIGLENVARRLQLLYEDRHTLSLRENDGQYEVHLEIPLDYDQMPGN